MHDLQRGLAHVAVLLGQLRLLLRRQLLLGRTRLLLRRLLLRRLLRRRCLLLRRGGADEGQEGGGQQETMVHAGSSMRSEEHTSELQSLMRISYAVFCLKKK